MIAVTKVPEDTLTAVMQEAQAAQKNRCFRNNKVSADCGISRLDFSVQLN